MTYIINQLGISLFLLRIAMIASSCLSCSSISPLSSWFMWLRFSMWADALAMSSASALLLSLKRSLPWTVPLLSSLTPSSSRHRSPIVLYVLSKCYGWYLFWR